jgi:hypothetical protein
MPRLRHHCRRDLLRLGHIVIDALHMLNKLIRRITSGRTNPELHQSFFMGLIDHAFHWEMHNSFIVSSSHAQLLFHPTVKNCIIRRWLRQSVLKCMNVLAKEWIRNEFQNWVAFIKFTNPIKKSARCMPSSPHHCRVDLLIFGSIVIHALYIVK